MALPLPPSKPPTASAMRIRVFTTHVSALATLLVAGMSLIPLQGDQLVVIDGIVGFTIVVFVFTLYLLMWAEYFRNPSETRTVMWAAILFVPVFGSLAYYWFVWRNTREA